VVSRSTAPWVLLATALPGRRGCWHAPQPNWTRLDYRRYRLEGWFIGSGVVEAGCKRLIGQRLKQSGMFWTEPGATAVASLRGALLSAGGWDFLWSQPLFKAA